jgi:DMSO/TMAO reductase YedYZ molybdopterin-dependent catalytic subunit
MPSPLWLIALVPLLAAGLLLLVRGRLLRSNPGLGAFLRHGKWPRGYALSHAGFILGFPLLMVSGVALYLEAWHRALIAWLPHIENLHAWGGIAFAALILLGTAGLLGRPRRPRWLDWSLTALLTALVTLSGFALWLPGRFPASWDAVAFAVHGWVSYAWLGWLLVHAALRLFSFQRKHPLNARFDYARRDALIGTAGATVLGAGALSWLGRPSADAPAQAGAQTSGAVQSSAGSTPRPRQTRFPAYYTYANGYPSIDPATFKLRIEGLVDHPLELTLAQLEALDQVRERRTFTCVTGWSVPNVLWTGVHLQTLLELAGAHAGATHLIFHSGDGVYVDHLTVEQAKRPGVLLAHRLDDAPLPREGGYPLRLVVPPMYGYKSVKWVDRIVVADHGVVGTWERYGYADAAWIGGNSA